MGTLACFNNSLPALQAGASAATGNKAKHHVIGGVQPTSGTCRRPSGEESGAKVFASWGDAVRLNYCSWSRSTICLVTSPKSTMTDDQHIIVVLSSDTSQKCGPQRYRSYTGGSHSDGMKQKLKIIKNSFLTHDSGIKTIICYKTNRKKRKTKQWPNARPNQSEKGSAHETNRDRRKKTKNNPSIIEP